MTKISGVDAAIVAEIVAEVVITQFRAEGRAPSPLAFIYHTRHLRGYEVDARLIAELNTRLNSRHLKVIELPATEEEGYDGDIVLVYAEKHPTRL